MKVELNQKEGKINIGGEPLGCGTIFKEFKIAFANRFHDIYGSNGTGKYGLIETVEIFGEDFRFYFGFEEGLLRRCSIELIGGIAKGQTEEYPDYLELQKEIKYLVGIYRDKLDGNFIDEFDWKKIWTYDWGEISLTQIAHNARVVTDVIWS